MKQKLITTDKATILALELPKECINPVISMGYLLFREPNYKNWATDDVMSDPVKLNKYLKNHNPLNDYKDAEPFKVADGEWKLVGLYSEVTEQQASEVVDTHLLYEPHEQNYPTAYLDYVSGNYVWEHNKSLDSLLEANEVWFENPIKHPNQMQAQPASFRWYKDQVRLYEEAQSKVWDKSRTYLFKKP